MWWALNINFANVISSVAINKRKVTVVITVISVWQFKTIPSPFLLGMLPNWFHSIPFWLL